MRLYQKAKIVLKVLIILVGLYMVNYIVTPNLIGIVNLELYCRPRGKLKFDSEIWKQAEPASRTRYEMVDDLLDSGLLRNLDVTQIEGLLGKPDLVSDVDGEKLLVYYLAYQRDYPSKSVFFPYIFSNFDQWMLEIRIRNGKCYLAKVFFT